MLGALTLFSGLDPGLPPGGAVDVQAAAVPPKANASKPGWPVPAAWPGDGEAAADDPEPALPPVPGQHLVRLRAGVSAAQWTASLASREVGLRSARAVAPGRASLQDRGRSSVFRQLVLVDVGEGAGSAARLQALRRQRDVLYVEPNSRLQVYEAGANARVPDDFGFAQQWSLRNTGQDGGFPGVDLSAVEAWAVTTGDRGARVAVIDTGIDFFHPDLEANVWVNPGEIPGDGLDNDRNGYVDDVTGYDFVSRDGDAMDDGLHGTHVAGIIGAVANNRIGVAGVCWEVSLMALKAFNENGEATLADVLEALDYAVANGARIVNASWGQRDKSRALAEAVAEVHAAGLVLVAAAGNDRSDRPSYPAAYPEAVTVAASTSRDQRAVFSNYGSFVDLAAPGDLVYATLPNAQYALLSGTSMAAPHVSGAAALVLSRHPGFSNAEVENLLRSSVDPLSAERYIGLGRLNLAKAVAPDAPVPNARLRLPEAMQGLTDVSGTATSAQFARYVVDFGQGVYPTNWTLLHESDVAVADGLLVRGLASDRLPEGPCVVRLRVWDRHDQVAEDRADVVVRNVHLERPWNNDILRAGETVPVQGSVYGRGRTYRLEYGVGWRPTVWLTNGITLVDGGRSQVQRGLLATWDTRVVEPNRHYNLRLTSEAEHGTRDEWWTELIFLDGQLRPGWPQYLPVEGDYFTNDWRDLNLADLDADGRIEVLRVDPGTTTGKPARLLVFGPDGQVRWSTDLATGEPAYDIPVVGDLDGDGLLEVFVDVGDPPRLFAFGHDGVPLPGRWPVSLAAGGLGKVVADLDGDGQAELVTYSNEPVAGSLNGPRQLTVWRPDGSVLAQWTLGSCDQPSEGPKMFPAVGDLDGDGELEIVAVLGCSEVGLFDWRRADQPVWRATLDGALHGSPVVGDLDDDGHYEVVIGVHDPVALTATGFRGGVYVLDDLGRPKPGWPVLAYESFIAAPALADLDGDGTLEIAIPSWRSQRLHVLDHRGFERAGWPVGPLNGLGFRSAPVIGDVDGDGHRDVVMALPGQFLQTVTSGNLQTLGGVYAWRADGSAIDLNPHPDIVPLVMESGSGAGASKAPPPLLTDLDGNGRLDVVASSVDDRSYQRSGFTRKNRHSLYAWELAAPFDAASFPWPMFQRDPQHSAFVARPRPVNQPPRVTPLPDQTVRQGGEFFAIELDAYVEDPDDFAESIVWTVAGQVELEVTISPDRVLRVAPPTPVWVGQERLRLTATDPGGLEAAIEVAYAARADYHPPRPAPDDATGLEDEPILIDALANDTHPLGLELRVIGSSRPRHGTVRTVGPARFEYLPRQDFNGEDNFTYAVGDAQGGMAIAEVRLEVLPVQDPPRVAPDRAVTDEDTPVSLALLANDADPDGDALEVIAIDPPAHGQAQLTADRQLRYVPNPDFNGVELFGYSAADPSGNLGTNYVEVMVKPVNDPPAARDLAFTLNRNSQQDIIYLADDPDSTDLEFRVVDAPQHGELWNYPNLATYVPRRGFSGTDRFTYQASDDASRGRVATITLTVLDRNNPPTAEALSLTNRVGQPLSLTLNARDLDGDPLDFEWVRHPANGLLAGAGSNHVYLPNPGFQGEDFAAFIVRDRESASAETTVRIWVTDQNTAPVASIAVIEVPMNTPVPVMLAGADAEQDPLTFRVVSLPERGELSGTPPDLVFTPQPGYVGPDRFTFVASDGELESEPAQVTLDVVQPNHAPVALDQVVPVENQQRVVIDLLVTDADGDRLRTAILKGPSYGRLAGMGTRYVYTPNPGFQGQDRFTYKSWDGTIYSAVASVRLQVNPVEPVPAPAFRAILPLAGGGVQLTLQAATGRPLRLESSTNLVDWITHQKLVTEGETVTVLDTNLPPATGRFYRALLY